MHNGKDFCTHVSVERPRWDVQQASSRYDRLICILIFVSKRVQQSQRYAQSWRRHGNDCILLHVLIKGNRQRSLLVMTHTVAVKCLAWTSRLHITNASRYHLSRFGSVGVVFVILCFSVWANDKCSNADKSKRKASTQHEFQQKEFI